MDINIPRIGIAVIVIKDNKVLLGKRKGAHGQGHWAPPGGHLEFQETPQQCAYRELLEETGLEAFSFKQGPWSNNIFSSGKHYVTLFIYVDSFAGEPQVLESDKCECWRWFDFEKLPSPLFETFESFLQL